jgi:hypothetical protein
VKRDLFHKTFEKDFSGYRKKNNKKIKQIENTFYPRFKLESIKI